MKKPLSIICLLFITVHISAQKRLAYEYGLSNVYNYAGFSYVEFLDPYLSLLNYTGYGGRVEHTTMRYFNADKKGLISFAKISGAVGLTYNPTKTASVMFGTANTGWGVLHENLNYNNLRLLSGANIDLDFTYKMNSRNVNNPISMDLSTNLNAMLGAEYFFFTKKRVMKLRSNIELPFIGSMFFPYPGLTFYELSLSKDFMQVLHFSSLHNKQEIKFQLAFDMPFQYSCWTLGVRTHFMQYKTKEHQYRYNELTAFIGITYDLIRFAGRRNPNPRYFTSPGEYFF